jgi:hypothetical protein
MAKFLWIISFLLFLGGCAKPADIKADCESLYPDDKSAADKCTEENMRAHNRGWASVVNRMIGK